MKHGKVAVKKLRPTGRAPVSGVPTLEKVIGTTARGGNAVSHNYETGDVAYVASGVIVFYNPESNK
jgi:hypothetical protein